MSTDEKLVYDNISNAGNTGKSSDSHLTVPLPSNKVKIELFDIMFRDLDEDIKDEDEYPPNESDEMHQSIGE
jgi:hypothetical protein